MKKFPAQLDAECLQQKQPIHSSASKQMQWFSAASTLSYCAAAVDSTVPEAGHSWGLNQPTRPGDWAARFIFAYMLGTLGTAQHAFPQPQR
jgi:hypothetical protein